MTSFERVLVANRGEIARRVIRTCRDMGFDTVAVFSDADEQMAWVREADRAERLGEASAAASYLDVSAVIAAGRRAGVDAVHPGYGFLSENASFAQAVLDEGWTWIGPSPDAIAAMGDKLSARKHAIELDVPVLTGRPVDGIDDAMRTAAEIGYPVLIKAVAGGGGRGMRAVHSEDALAENLQSAQREALAGFADDRVYLEKLLVGPRHVEIQILGDQHGRIWALGERECSVQRRHQKVFEESPAVAVPLETRQAMAAAAVRLASHIGYVGAGTVEFLVGADGDWFFLEMNTRLQVEHPVTEEVWGLDLVRLQLDVAGGAALSERPDPVGHGVSIEARIYAEDPWRDGLPSTGRLLRCDWPSGAGIRVDAGFRHGDVVTPHYDAMLGKIIASGVDRPEAARRLRHALDRAWVPGVTTNLSWLRDIVRRDEWVAGEIHTGWMGALDVPLPPAHLERGACLATAIRASLLESTGPGTGFGWRLHGDAGTSATWSYLDTSCTVNCRRQADGFQVAVGDDTVLVKVLDREGDRFVVSVDGSIQSVRVAWDGPPNRVPEGRPVYLHLGDGEAMVTLAPRFPRPKGAADDPGTCSAPMPGVVRAVHVAVGDTVAPGDPLVTLEAMKMEHVLAAPEAGSVDAIGAAVGDSVPEGAWLVRLTLPEASEA